MTVRPPPTSTGLAVMIGGELGLVGTGVGTGVALPGGIGASLTAPERKRLPSGMPKFAVSPPLSSPLSLPSNRTPGEIRSVRPKLSLAANTNGPL